MSGQRGVGCVYLNVEHGVFNVCEFLHEGAEQAFPILSLFPLEAGKESRDRLLLLLLFLFIFPAAN